MGHLNDCIIAYKSLSAGSFDYSFTLDNEFFSRYEGSEITAGNCQAQVQLQRGESMLEVDVKIEGDVVVACDRCLEDCSVEIDYQGQLIVKFSSEIEDYDGEVLWLSPTESEVDLSQYIYESVVLSLPYQRVHADGECNQEMISKFAAISGSEPSGAESEAGMSEESDQAAEAADQEQDTHGLSLGDLAKLQALKEKLESE